MEILSRANQYNEHELSYISAVSILDKAEIQKPKTKNDYLAELLEIYHDPKEVAKRKVENWDRYIKYYCKPKKISVKDMWKKEHIEAFKKHKMFLNQTKDTLWVHFMYCNKEDMAFVVSSARSRLQDGLNVSSWMLTCTKNKHMV